MKLERHHIAPYWPHDLRLLIDGKVYILTGLSKPYKTNEKSLLTAEIRPKNGGFDTITSFVFNDTETPRAKLLLRPLPDLIREIEHNGQKFIPSQAIHEDELFQSIVGMFSIGEFGIEDLNYGIIIKLFEWHFNVFNLPQELWIDINTIQHDQRK